MSAPTPTSPTPRLVSLDALRGFDMFWILGGDALVYALAKAWKIPPFQFLAMELDHADWAGFRAYDLIFPLFVFMAGASMAFALNRIIAEKGRGAAVKRVLVRSPGVNETFLTPARYCGTASDTIRDVWPSRKAPVSSRGSGSKSDSSANGKPSGNRPAASESPKYPPARRTGSTVTFWKPYG